MDVRKNFSKLTPDERKRVIAAIKWMKNNDKAGTSTTGGLYQNYVNFHAFGSITKRLKNFQLTIAGAPTSILHSIVIDDEEWVSPSKQAVTRTGLETFFNTEIRISGGGNATGDPFNEIIVAGVAPSFTINWNSSPFDKIELKVTPSGSTTPTTLTFTSSPVTPARDFAIDVFNLAHNNPSFLPWHRVFLRLFEIDLQFADKKLGGKGDIALPYWDFVTETSLDEASARSVWHKDNFGGFGEEKLGGTGPDKDRLIGKVTGTHFSPGKWKVFPPLLDPPNNLDFLIRRRSSRKSVTFPTRPNIRTIMGMPDFRSPSPGVGGGAGTGRGGNNRFAGRYETNVHNPLHGIVGGDQPTPPAVLQVDVGHMTNPVVSPQDPVFFPFHCNIDRLWAIWQVNPPRMFNLVPAIFGPRLALKFQYPKFGLLPGRRFNDFMEPWAVKTGGPPSQFNVRVKDVLNISFFDAAVHTPLGTGYTYDDLLTANLTTF